MKNFFRALFLLIAISSLVGIVFIVGYYIYKNLDLFKGLLKNIEDKISDYELTSKEVDSLANDVVQLEKKIEKDVKGDVKKVKKEVSKKVSKIAPVKKVKSDKNETLNARQKEVLSYIKQNSNSKMSSVSKIFNKVTPRTLRRDLEKLEQLGLLRQEGKTRDAIYKIV